MGGLGGRSPGKAPVSRTCPLLLQKAAVLLSATVPATRSHAVRLPRAAVGHADRQKRAIGVLPAICNAGGLLTDAAHGHRDRGLGPEQDKQGRSYADKSPKVEV